MGEHTAEVNEDTAGATRSRVSVVVDVDADVGPVFEAPSVTVEASRRGWRVPVVPHVVTVTVTVVPDEALGVNVQPVAVPALSKSLAAIPVTLRSNASE